MSPNALFSSSHWDFQLLKRVDPHIAEIAFGELGLDIYPIQYEVITSEQMLDAYASVGLPLMYRHWSFGKRFAYHETLYRKGLQGLAYEIVINSNPVICYIMEENTALMQTLVMAHAAYGHNHFFKNNYLFRQWSDAGAILDYLAFARDYVSKCEEKYGQKAVELVLDAAHALKEHGVFRSTHRAWDPRRQADQLQARLEDFDHSVDLVLDSTMPANVQRRARPHVPEEQRRRLIQDELPAENLLYIIEQFAPGLPEWKRELIRIVRTVNQYFYPQKQLQVMNEGCATFCHYYILNRLFDKGLLPEGAMLEFLHSHSSVVFQPDFDDSRFSGFNPYALGFAIMRDIHRICTNPTEEDREWFNQPDAFTGETIAGNRDPYSTLRHIWANYRDESFIAQYLSPAVIRQFRIFTVEDDQSKPAMRVAAIGVDERDSYRRIRTALSHRYDLSRLEPDIQAVDADLSGDRVLHLVHRTYDGIHLEEKTCRSVLGYAAALWGYPVKLEERKYETNTDGTPSDKILRSFDGSPPARR